jgi:CHAT domain-containing protein
MGDHAQAEWFYLQALEVHHSSRIPTDADTGRRLHDLACFLADESGYSVEADDPLYQSAYQLFLSTQGEAVPSYTSSQYGLACVYAATGRVAEARSLMRQAAAGDDLLIGQVFVLGSEAQRANFLQTVWPHLAVHLSLVHRCFPHSAAEVRAALELTWRRKGIGAEALNAQREAVLNGRHPSAGPQLRELNTLRNWITKKALEGPGLEGSAGHLECLQRWHAERNVLESRLARLTPEIHPRERLLAARLQAVGRCLPPDTSLVEYVRSPLRGFLALPYQGEPDTSSLHYLAFATPGSSNGVSLIDLGEAEPIDRLVKDFRAGVTGQTEPRDLSRVAGRGTWDAGAPAGECLRAAVFDPLAGALGTSRRLFLASDGDLNRLPFEVLPLADGRHLLDAYRISYASVGRDVLRFQARSGRQPAAPLVAADPDFDLTAAFALPSATQVMGPLSRDLGNRRFHFLRLPGTRAEGERIARRLGVQPQLGGAALEGRLKACRSPRILHLATHGFFLPDQPRDLNQLGRNLELIGVGETPGLGRLSGPGMEDPMLRSGLALAGANTFLRGAALPAEAEDGLLTAEDVAGLDLLDTELVVLSACETGLGDVHVGEGVFGLRRAFIVAGAKTLVMSLWKVPDLATAFLMDRFYDNLLTRGLDRDLALSEAQRYTRDATIAQLKAEWLAPDMIEQFAAGDAEARRSLEALAAKPDDHRPFERPFFWGAFICQGDPSPLPAVTPGPASRHAATAGK